MADFVLTQTDSQVQSVLNDAQDAQGAGAQTTLTTEYVMLKDTNGRYHKILKSSLTEACRNVLASLLVNNDKGTTISQIAAIASGDFGSVTPANLASVLGGVYTLVTTTSDLYSLPKTGWYYWGGSGSAPQNNAVPQASAVLYYSFGNLRILIQFQNVGGIYYNVKWDYDGGTWRGWREVSQTALPTT